MAPPSLLALRCSVLPLTCSLIPIPYSLFPVPYTIRYFSAIKRLNLGW